jgi:Tfp pilus assembly protein PilP
LLILFHKVVFPDWPFVYGLLGDIPINAAMVQARNMISYRVEQPLLAPDENERAGYVPNVERHLQETAAFVVPLKTGAGMRVKILDAWCWALIAAPNHHVYRVTIGDRVGQVLGIVKQIHKDKIEIAEPTENGARHFILRMKK